LAVSNDRGGEQHVRRRPVTPNLDPLIDLYEFLDKPISLGRIFHRPRQMAIVLAIGIVLAGIDQHRRLAAKALWPTDAVREAEASTRYAFV
jgi:hypothetical protein